MTKLAGDDGQWRVIHSEVTGVGVAQDVEGYGRFNLGLLAGINQAAVLVGAAPRITVFMCEQQIAFRHVLGNAGEEQCGFLSKHHMAAFAVLAGANPQPSRVKI